VQRGCWHCASITAWCLIYVGLQDIESPTCDKPGYDGLEYYRRRYPGESLVSGGWPEGHVSWCGLHLTTEFDRLHEMRKLDNVSAVVQRSLQGTGPGLHACERHCAMSRARMQNCM
jgi:hypothetical protein